LRQTQGRAQIKTLATYNKDICGEHGALTYADQVYTRDIPTGTTSQHGIELHVFKLHNAKHGFVLLPRCWVAECSFA
jgi:hypothetical protein